MGCGASKSEILVPQGKLNKVREEGQTENSSVKHELIKNSNLEFDPDVDKELNGLITDKFGKKKSPYERAANRQEDYAAALNIDSDGQGEQFLAIKPWTGALIPPSNPPEFQQSLANVDFQLEYIYGYRCFDSRQNVFYTNDNNSIVYMAAALGVVLNKTTNTQKFFGGGKVSVRSSGHTDDITALAISNGRELVATGDVGAKPCVFVWNALTQHQVAQLDIGRGRRAVSSLAFSHNNSHIAATDLHNDHYVSVWEVNTGIKVAEDKGGPDKIFGVAWSASKPIFVTVGVKHIVFWEFGAGMLTHKKGLYGNSTKMTNHLVAKWSNNGFCITGGANGILYLWQEDTNGPKPSFSLLRMIDAPGMGVTIHSLNIIDDVLYVAARDGKIRAYDASNFEPRSEYNTPNTFAKAIDKCGNNLLVGCRDGSIREIDITNNTARVLVESHCDGELWGLAVHPKESNIVLTAADDNMIKAWDFKARTCIGSGTLDKAKEQGGKLGKTPSTLASTTANQQSRAVAINPTNGHIAVAHNSGKVTVRPSFRQLDQIAFSLSESKEWSQVLKYSPCGNKLAVGSHDNNIYLYDVNSSYTLAVTCKGHSSFITALDWSSDSFALHSTCGSYELLFWDAKTGTRIKDGATRLRDEKWANWTIPFGWPVQGIFPRNVDNTHVNAVDRATDSLIVAVGNDWGLVEVFGFPNKEGAQSHQYRGHSEHVANVQFSKGDGYIFSVGGFDQTLMQWKQI